MHYLGIFLGYNIVITLINYSKIILEGPLCAYNFTKYNTHNQKRVEGHIDEYNCSSNPMP